LPGCVLRQKKLGARRAKRIRRMSYDLRIYTIEKQDFNCPKNTLKIKMTDDGFIYPIKNHQIAVTGETPIEHEDIPQQISKALPG
jgi:hypothetical protein